MLLVQTGTGNECLWMPINKIDGTVVLFHKASLHHPVTITKTESSLR